MIDAALRDALEATWPAAETAAAGGFVIGRDEGAGGRVSSARAQGGDWTEAGIAAAEAQAQAWGQPPLFRVEEGEAPLAEALAARGYRREDPVLVMAAGIAALTALPVPPMTAFVLWPPMAVHRDLWTAAGTGPARQAVMARVPGPRTALLGRAGDRVAGAGFVAVHGPVAVLHALIVEQGFRRKGIGAALVRAGARWAAGEGAGRVALAVHEANEGAVALYRGLGFETVGGYAYWRKGPAA